MAILFRVLLCKAAIRKAIPTKALRNINDAIHLHITDILAEGGSVPAVGTFSLTTMEIAA